MSGKLSTHILDTHSGCPAGGVQWTLNFSGDSGTWIRLSEGRTNGDGRTDGPLLEGDALKTGAYRLVFDVGSYFAEKGIPLSEPAFLGKVALEVNLIAGQSYHVPLLTSPWSYSTYRGS